MSDKMKEQFEAWISLPDQFYLSLKKRSDGSYHDERTKVALESWKAALSQSEPVQVSQEEITQAHYLERLQTIGAENEALKTENSKLHAAIQRRVTDLAFVERWVNHHGVNSCHTAEEVLSVIQHYPSITEITESYKDGVIPATRNPYAEIEALRKQLSQAEQATTVEAKIVDELSACNMLLKEDYQRACRTVASMHLAAMGEVVGPNRGVVEDIADLKAERDRLQSECDRLRDAAKQALLALHFHTEQTRPIDTTVHAMDTLNTALMAAPKREE
jgi:vacuolar-type H+-ATPase subunit I/STV1